MFCLFRVGIFTYAQSGDPRRENESFGFFNTAGSCWQPRESFMFVGIEVANGGPADLKKTSKLWVFSTWIASLKLKNFRFDICQAEPIHKRQCLLESSD